MAKSKQVRFNVKNVKYAMKTAGVYGTPVDLGYAKKLALEADFDVTTIYGDGLKLGEIIDDKGKKGTLSLIDQVEDYEIACGRQMLIDGGNAADVTQINSMPHALYYETDLWVDGVRKVVKVWLLNVTSAPAGESLDQTEDNPSFNPVDYPITIFGETLLANGGLSDYQDDNGNTVRVTRVFSYPDDSDYSTFGSAVPSPEAAS